MLLNYGYVKRNVLLATLTQHFICITQAACISKLQAQLDGLVKHVAEVSMSELQVEVAESS